MSLSILPKLLLLASMLLLVSCTLVINSAKNAVEGTGLGNGTVSIESDASVIATCKITAGVPDAGCNLSIPGSQTVILTATASGDSTFVEWTGECDSVNGAKCTVTFKESTDTITVTAYFRRLYCQGTDACTGLVNSPPGEGSCNGGIACLTATGPIGNNSCNGGTACSGVVASIGNNSCNGLAACYGASVAIGNNSCNTTTGACRTAVSAIGDCMFNSVKPEACP